MTLDVFYCLRIECECDEQTNEQTNNAVSRVAFATENA